MTFSAEPINHIDVGATLSRLETGVAPIPVEMSLASLAISINRMANCLYNIETVLRTNTNIPAKMDELRYAIKSVSDNGNAAYGAANSANMHLNSIGRALEEMLKHAKASDNPTG